MTCDHASRLLPPGYGSLGLPASEFDRHIASDIGAAGVSRGLSRLLDCPALLAGYSRLLIDLNRGEDDPTLVMKLSDGAIIPANRHVDADNDKAEFEARIDQVFRPYHAALGGLIDRALAAGTVPVILSMHSFTPSWRGRSRPWKVGILWDRDDRIAGPLIGRLREEPGMIVGDNEPYEGALYGDCLFRHGTLRGIAHVLVEIRQDLIMDEEGQEAWAALLAPIFQELASRPGVREIRHFGSLADPSAPISPK
ncbi:MAG: N-formylglutamate amidohydrolase [Parvibaculaceae bacterium]|nr:N-formylglutamate amidohydrolase [Parvibaculaceae bacterium]